MRIIEATRRELILIHDMTEGAAVGVRLITAQRYGAEFRDGCKFLDFKETSGRIIVQLKTNGVTEEVAAKYVVDAMGTWPAIQRKLHQDTGYRNESTGATLNYYSERLKYVYI